MRPTRGRAMAAVALTAVLTFALAALPWFRAPVDSVQGRVEVVLPGTGASPTLGALLLVVAAGLVAYLLARGPLARVVAAVVALAGTGVVAACVGALLDPGTPLARLAAETSGVPDLAGEVSRTPWGVVATGAAVLLALSGVALALAPPAVAGRSRYERPVATAPSAGHGHGSGARPEREVPGDVTPSSSPVERSSGATDTPAARAAQVDDWDALSRGEDPTR